MLLDEFDLEAMLEPFGVPIIANVGTGDEIHFTGIFDRPQKMEFGNLKGPAIIDQDASILCRDIDVTDLQQNKPISINNVKYKIRECLPDGTGLTTINLLRMQKSYK